MLDSFLFLAKRSGTGQWSLVRVLKRSGTVSVKTVHKECGTTLLKRCWLNSQKVDVQFSAQRAHCPEVNSKTKDMENCRYTMQPIWKRLRLFSHNCQCKPAESLRSSRRGMWRVWILSWKNGETRCDGAIEFLTRAQRDQDRSPFWIVITQRIKIFHCNNMENELKSCHNKTNWVNFCMNAGSLNVVNGQYFMTKDTADLSQFHAVAYREYTRPREEPASQPKGWIQGNTKIGPVSEVATSYWNGKYGVEIGICSSNRVNTHSWVRISQGSDKFVMNLNSNETEIPERSALRICVKTECERFCMPIKGKNKTTKKRTCRLFTKNSSYWDKELDWHRNREIFFLRLWSIEESNVSSSSFTTCASRRRWSSSYLENKRKSSESVPTLSSLVWR